MKKISICILVLFISTLLGSQALASQSVFKPAPTYPKGAYWEFKEFRSHSDKPDWLFGIKQGYPRYESITYIPAQYTSVFASGDYLNAANTSKHLYLAGHGTVLSAGLLKKIFGKRLGTIISRPGVATAYLTDFFSVMMTKENAKRLHKACIKASKKKKGLKVIKIVNKDGLTGLFDLYTYKFETWNEEPYVRPPSKYYGVTTRLYISPK